MNYLKIKNDGLICAEDLMLIGSSTKRDQVGKIGFFGSGWKFALSWLLRNDCKPTIFSGNEKIEVDFLVKMHRDNAVRVITVNGQETSLTTEMGPKWTGWMALREIISNARDEGGDTIESAYNPIMSGEENKTVIYIPLNSELGEVMLKFDNYFAFNRIANYNFTSGRVFVKKEESKLNIYRKGIRCYDTPSESLLDFDLYDVSIDENRLATFWDIGKKIQLIVEENRDSILLKKIIEEEQGHFMPDDKPNENIMIALRGLIDSGETFTTSNIKNLTGSLFASAKALSIPQKWYDHLRDMKLIKSAFQFLAGNIQFMRTDEKDLKGVEYYLAEYNVKMELQSGSCNKEAIFSNGIGYVKADTVLSDKEIAAKLLGTAHENFWKERLGVPIEKETDRWETLF